MKKNNPLDVPTFAAIFISFLVMCGLMMGSGCALHAKIYPKKAELCCDRLDVRLGAMEEFNRYCMMIVFAARKETDPKVLVDIKRRIELCKFVFGVADDEDVLSALEEKGEQLYKVRSSVVPIRSGAWHPPLGCDPHEIHCEEF